MDDFPGNGEEEDDDDMAGLEEEQEKEKVGEEVGAEEASWRNRLYDLIGPQVAWLKDGQTNAELPSRFKSTITQNQGQRIDGKLVINIAQETGRFYLHLKGRRIVCGRDLVQISRRMCELIPGMYAALKHLQAAGLYCPPKPVAEWEFGDIPETDPLHHIGLLRGGAYSCKFMFETWSRFYEVLAIPGVLGGVAGGVGELVP